MESIKNPPKPLPLAARKFDYSLKIPVSLLERIDAHISRLKYLDNNCQSRQRWLIEAFKERLKNESNPEEKIAPEDIPPPKSLSFKVDENIHEKLEKKAAFQKKFQGTFSKNLWMLQAIEKKIQLDEEPVIRQVSVQKDL